MFCNHWLTRYLVRLSLLLLPPVCLCRSGRFLYVGLSRRRWRTTGQTCDVGVLLAGSPVERKPVTRSQHRALQDKPSEWCVLHRRGVKPTLARCHPLRMGRRQPELFTAFSYTGSPKTEQGGDNQARHVVLTLESGISLLVALFPVKKSQKSQKSHSSGHKFDS